MKTETIEKVKERPMLFSTPMVIAVLDDRKDVTRRVKGLEVINQNPDDWEFNWFDYQVGWCFNQKSTLTPERLLANTFNQEVIKCPYGLKGDILWVRESIYSGALGDAFYVAGGDPVMIGDLQLNTRNRSRGSIPSIHMKREYCRLRLQIKSISVERLHDITEEDAIREGAPMYVPGHGIISTSDLKADPGYSNFLNYRMGFEHLWQSINGKESWDSNPWCWRIEFEKL